MQVRAVFALLLALFFSGGAAAATTETLERERAGALLRAAETLSSLGDSLGAQRALRSALALRPDDAELLLALAQSLRDRPRGAAPARRTAAVASAAPSARRQPPCEIAVDLEIRGGGAGLARALRWRKTTWTLRAWSAKRGDGQAYAQGGGRRARPAVVPGAAIASPR